MASDFDALTALAERWRHPPGRPARFVPGFDPVSGGAGSRVLVLMQSPGPATIAQGADAISSEDNPGPTAAAFRAARVESGLSRSSYLRWNIVPWALDGSPTLADLDDARPALAALMELLTQLRAVVSFGSPALTGMMRYMTLSDTAIVVPVLGVPHLSPANATRHTEKHLRAVTALRHAGAL